jgi:hypothetical protein
VSEIDPPDFSAIDELSSPDINNKITNLLNTPGLNDPIPPANVNEQYNNVIISLETSQQLFIFNNLYQTSALSTDPERDNVIIDARATYIRATRDYIYQLQLLVGGAEYNSLAHQLNTLRDELVTSVNEFEVSFNATRAFLHPI